MDPLELVYDSMDAVPEAYAGLYTEQDGKAVLTHVNGLKTEKDVATVQEALRKERDDHKKTKDLLKPWKDMDPEETRTQLDRIHELETAAGGKLDEDAINKIVEGRLKQRTAPLERQISELTETNTTLKTERDNAFGTITDMKMTSAIRRAANEAKVLGTAIPDVEIIAKSAFELTDDGNLITKDNSGVTPGLGLDAYFREMATKRPHWFPPSEGGGAGGGRSQVPGGGPNPWKAETWDMTKQGQIVRENRELADQLAKAAGTTVGGMKPTKKS